MHKKNKPQKAWIEQKRGLLVPLLAKNAPMSYHQSMEAGRLGGLKRFQRDTTTVAAASQVG